MLEPFTIATADEALVDLRARLNCTRPSTWPEDVGWDDGTEPGWLDSFVSYWRDAYDWRAQERTLNRFRHHRTTVDGTALHVIVEKGVGPDPLPLILTHGYPDSFYRF